MYYAIQVNEYASKNQPKGFDFPKLTDFWKSLVVALATQLGKGVADKLLYPAMYKIVKVSENEQYKQKHAHKAADYLFSTIMYIVVSVWGFIVLKDSPFLPWFMGGRH